VNFAAVSLLKHPRMQTTHY